MSANIQKRSGSGPWLPWSSAATVDLAIKQVKGYAIGDDCHWTGKVEFELGPLSAFPVLDEIRNLAGQVVAMIDERLVPENQDMGSVEISFDGPPSLGLSVADAAAVLKPRVGDRLTVKITGPETAMVWVDRA